MRGLIRLSVGFQGILAGLGAGVLALWPIGAAVAAVFPPGNAKGGTYLSCASGRVSCHTDTAAKGLALAGSVALDRPFGTFVPPYIAPHQEAGIGRRTNQDFAKAVRQGISPDGNPCGRVFTSPSQAGSTDQDIAGLRGACRTVPPVAGVAPPHDVGLPPGFRPGLELWRAACLVRPETDATMDTSARWNRGRLLVEGTAHDAVCQMGGTLAGGLDDGGRLAGNDSLPGASKSPSILKGGPLARRWTVANLTCALQPGPLPNGDAFGGSKAEVVTEGNSDLIDADPAVIATFLLDPEGAGRIPAPLVQPDETPSAG